MKKILCFIICLAMSLASISALAEEFTLHSGVKFGMTVDEVVALEENAGFKVSSYTAEESTYLKNTEMGVLAQGKMVGIEDSSITYFIDETRGVIAARYFLDGSRTNDVCQDGYTTVEKALRDKYGTPTNTNMWVDQCINEVDYRPFAYMLSVAYGGVSIKIIDASAWTIQQEDNSYVLIIHYLFSQNGHYLDNIGYQHFSQEEIDSIMNRVHDESAENQQQLDDDL